MTSAPSTQFRPVYNWQDDVENLEYYCVGGYHPVELGDRFKDGRYQVVHKLGHGGSSTVWLAKDHVNDRYVSLKILKALLSKLSSEVMIRGLLREGNQHHPGRSHVLPLLDEFHCDGPNGRHQCLVSDLTGPTVPQVREATESETLSIETAQSITAQLALGLTYIHSCGVVHGDLHSHNVVTQLPNIDSWTIEQLYSSFGEPEQVPITRCDTKPLGPEAPAYAVQPAYFWSLGCENLLKRIQIIDFGEAFLERETRKQLYTPLHFRAPESFFNTEEGVGASADIWAFGCTVFDFFCGHHHQLFDTYLPTLRSTLLEIIKVLGPIPSEWRENEKFLTNDNPIVQKVLNDPLIISNQNRSTTTLASLIQETHPCSSSSQSVGVTNSPQEPSQSYSLSMTSFNPDLDPEIKAQVQGQGQAQAQAKAKAQATAQININLENLLTACLKYIPAQRPTAQNVVDLEWIQESLKGNSEA